MVLTSRDFGFFRANPAFCRMLGYTSEEMNGLTFLDVTHPEHRAADRDNVERLWQGEIPIYRTEKRYIAKNGDIRWGNLSASLIQDREGRPLYALAIVEDITERKWAEEQVRRSEQDLNRAQAVAQTGSWRLDVRRNELLWSKETYRIFGVPYGTPMTYDTFLAAVHPADREYVDRQWTAALRGESYDIEHRILAEGTLKWVREKAELEFDDIGTVLGGFGTVQDVTERKRAEEALRASQSMLQLVMQNVPQGIFWKDRHSTYLGCNNVFAKNAGLESAEEIVGKTDYDLPWSPEQAASFREYDRRIMENDAPEYHIIEQQREANGNLAWLETNKVPLHDAQGQVIGILGTYEIITERKRAEEALREWNATLESRVAERTEELEQRARQLQKLTLELTEAEEREAQASGRDPPRRFAAGAGGGQVPSGPPEQPGQERCRVSGDRGTGQGFAGRRDRQIPQLVPRAQRAGLVPERSRRGVRVAGRADAEEARVHGPRGDEGSDRSGIGAAADPALQSGPGVAVQRGQTRRRGRGEDCACGGNAAAFGSRYQTTAGASIPRNPATTSGSDC